MKTNQTMLLQFDNKTLAVEHKTKMGSLTELWAIGNSIRESKGLTQMDMSNFLRSQETLELVQAIERKEGFKSVESTHLKNSAGLLTETIQSSLIRTKRGRYGGGTWAHLYILLDAASRMDADFKVRMYDILVEGKLLEWRDDSGDSFKALNVVLDLTIVKETGNRPETWVYKDVAKAIKDNVKPTGGDWNTATYDELKRRTTIENQLMTILKLGFIKSFEQLLQTIKDI
jgi:hypothetical protein